MYIHFDVEFPENSFQNEEGLQVSGQDDDVGTAQPKQLSHTAYTHLKYKRAQLSCSSLVVAEESVVTRLSPQEGNMCGIHYI